MSGFGKAFGAKPAKRSEPIKVAYSATDEILLMKVDTVWDEARTMEAFAGGSEMAASVAKTCAKITDAVMTEGKDCQTEIDSNKDRVRELLRHFIKGKEKEYKGWDLVNLACEVFGISVADKPPVVHTVPIPTPTPTQRPEPTPTQRPEPTPRQEGWQF